MNKVKRRSRKISNHFRKEDGVRVPLTEEEEEKEIIKMLDDHVPISEIAHFVRRNPNYITEINKRLKESRKPRQKSIGSLAFELYRMGKNSLDVAIELGLEGEEAEKYKLQHWHLCNLDELTKIYSDYGPQFVQLIGICKNLLDRGITISKALEILKLSYEVNNLYQNWNYLTEVVTNLTISKNQLIDENNQLKIQSGNLNPEIAEKRMMVGQLNQSIEKLSSVLNSINDGNIDYQTIKQIAKESGESLIRSRVEALECAVFAVILTLRKEPNLIPLLMAPIPAFQYPGFQDNFNQIALKAWDELSGQVNIMIMTVLFERLKGVVDNLKRQQT